MANIIRRNERVTQPGPIVARTWDPFDIMREMLTLDPLRQLTQPLAGQLPMHAFTPQFEVRETADRYLFKADVPGVKDADLDIRLDENRLTVSGRREAEQVDDNDRFYAVERSYGSFTRTFTLPGGIDGNHVTADLRDGVLLVEIPKAPEAQPRKITVRAGEGDGGRKNVRA